MSDKSKLIMETIVLVRSRKARPDLERICKTMQRNHGVEPKETEKWLDLLCDKGIVARRPFKGAVSYRIVADEKTGSGKSNVRYFRNVRKITKAISALDPHGLGVSFGSIERYITTHWPLTCSILSLRVRLRSSLRDGVEEGRFTKTLNGCYKLGLSQFGVEEVTEEEMPEENIEENGDDLLCDYCQQNADRNPFGEPEELLICKDCGNKAHPSCLNYSAELVEQIRADDSWQCIDCKACTICDGTSDPDSLLFCDACDKGYHMNCHTPKLDQMPSGKWMCNSCSIKRIPNGQNGNPNNTTANTPNNNNNNPVHNNASNSNVYIIDEENNTIRSAGNGSTPIAISNNSPPTMVQLQRTSQIKTGMSPGSGTSPGANYQNRQKSELIVRPRNSGSSQFRQPMITLGGSAQASHSRPAASTTHASAGILRGQPTILNTTSYAVPLASSSVNAKAQIQGVNSVHTKNKYQQANSFMREDVLRALPADVADWTVSDVRFYVKSHGFPGEAKLFQEQEVDGKAMLLMSRNDVLTGLRLKLGPALKIYHLHICRLQSRTTFIGM
eukprot:gene8225-9105_t